MSAGDERDLNRAFDVLERQVPARIAPAVRWLHEPRHRWVRIPIGVALIVASFFWFLPVIGIEFLPIGLLVIAQDVPFLRRPIGRMMLWLEYRWLLFRRWWRARWR